MGISGGIAAAAVAAGGSIAASSIQSNAAKGAANTQQQASQDANSTQIYMQQQAIDQQNQMFGLEAQLLNPQRQAGNYATQAIQQALGLPLTTLGAQRLPGGGTLQGTGSLGGGGGTTGGGANTLPQLGLNDYSTSQGGVLSPNASLYGTDQAYTQAWDQVASANKAAAGDKWNIQYSNPAFAAANQQGQTNLNQEVQRAYQAFQLQQQGAQPNATAGGQLVGSGAQVGMGGTGPATTGTNAYSNLFQPFNYTADQYHQSPGYQFALGQGLEAINNSAAARGMILSPNTSKALGTYATGLADQDFQQAYQNAYQAYTQNQSNTLNALSGMAGYGNTAATNLGSAAGNTGTNNASLLSGLGTSLGSNTIGAGNAGAAGIVGSGNAISGGITNLANTFNQSALMNQFLSPSSGTGYGFTMPGGNTGSSGGYNYTNPSYGLGSGLNFNLNQ